MLTALAERLPDHARDLRINLGAIAGSTALAPSQAWGVAIAAAVAAKCAPLVDALVADAPVATEVVAAARGAAAIMAMNNVYYRAVHFLGKAYTTLPARLRMQLIGRPGVPALDFELACLAASAVNGCEACVRAHERTVRERGGTIAAVHDALRIAAVVHGVAAAIATNAPE